MFSALRTSRPALRRVAAVAAALWLAACDTVGVSTRAPSVDPGAPVPVALLLPSGQPGDDVIARSMRQAAELAIADLSNVEIDLRVYQTGGGAGQAAAQAVADGAKVILGPLRGEEANAAGVAVAASGVNVLSFSNNSDIAGGNVFILGQTFQNTANRLVRYAAGQGIRRIAIVRDRGVSDEIISASVQRAITGNGSSVATVGSYEFSQQGVIAAAPGIARQIRESGAQAVMFTANPAGALPLVTQLVSEAGVNPAQVRYMGVTRWDQPSATLAHPPIQGGWFALPDPGLAAQFQARYTAAYGEPPHPLAGLAYDGIAAIGALARTGRPNALSAGSLTQGSGFAGVNGVFRLRPDGTNERGLAVATIRNNQVVVIDPAPRSFGGAGL